MLASGLVDFTVLEPEDLTILHTDVIDKSDVLITHELKMFSESQYNLLYILQDNIIYLK